METPLSLSVKPKDYDDILLYQVLRADNDNKPHEQKKFQSFINFALSKYQSPV